MRSAACRIDVFTSHSAACCNVDRPCCRRTLSSASKSSSVKPISISGIFPAALWHLRSGAASLYSGITAELLCDFLEQHAARERCRLFADEVCERDKDSKLVVVKANGDAVVSHPLRIGIHVCFAVSAVKWRWSGESRGVQPCPGSTSGGPCWIENDPLCRLVLSGPQKLPAPRSFARVHERRLGCIPGRLRQLSWAIISCESVRFTVIIFANAKKYKEISRCRILALATGLRRSGAA